MLTHSLTHKAKFSFWFCSLWLILQSTTSQGTNWLKVSQFSNSLNELFNTERAHGLTQLVSRLANELFGYTYTLLVLHFTSLNWIGFFHSSISMHLYHFKKKKSIVIFISMLTSLVHYLVAMYQVRTLYFSIIHNNIQRIRPH